MARTPPVDATDAHEPAGSDPPLPVGSFRYYFADQRWEWSPETARIHGYEPGEVTPTTELAMAHKHPDDRAQVAAHLDSVRHTGKPVSTRHRIIDAHGHTRQIVVAGQQIVNDDGAVVGTAGYYIDVTPTPGVEESARQQAITEGVAAVVQSRTLIDQIKGMLMLIYGVDATKAFDLLRWRSQETNTKVRHPAEQLIEDFLALTNDEQLPTRPTFDRVFLTAHLRAKVRAA